MKHQALTVTAATLLAMFATLAHAAPYTVTLRFYEPDTQPRDTIFIGTFDFDAATHAVSNLQGMLSESMTGDPIAYPDDTMTWLALSHQLVSWHDDVLEGTFAATFLNATTATFVGNTWAPADGVAVGGIYAGWPQATANPGNAYALIFVPDDPLALLSQAQLDMTAYADCAPGGMMGAVCMTGTSLAGYGATGTMSGYPVSQIITPAPVPEPETYALMLAGLGLVGWAARRRA